MNTNTIPEPIAQANDLARHVRNTINRFRTAMPRSMQDQLAGMVSFALRRAVSKQVVIYPGMEKMAKWGRCSDRQARKNFATLKAEGVVKVVGYEKGGRRSTRFVLDFSALVAFLTGVGVGVSKALLEKLRACRLWPRKSEVCGKRADGRNPELSSAGIHKLAYRTRLFLEQTYPWARPPVEPGGLRAVLLRQMDEMRRFLSPSHPKTQAHG